MKYRHMTSGKARTIAKASALLCYLGVQKLGLTCASIAKELGISPSAVSQSMVRGRRARQHKDIEEQLLESP